MSARAFFITGTDTGVGKTVLTAALTRCLREKGVNVRAVKPFCSGGREDAKALRAAQDGRVTLDEINPWHFRAPLTPLLAARQERVRVAFKDVTAFLRASARSADVLLIEGAGGLLSPLGEGYSARELIVPLRATPLVVCPDRLGVINQARLVVEALPAAAAARAKVVLVDQPEPDLSTRTNHALLTELLGPGRVFVLPRLPEPDGAEKLIRVRRLCASLLR